MTNKDEVKLNLQRQQKFGIRKFKVGVASVMFASFFYMNMAHVAQAAESQKLEISTVERKTETKQPSNLKSLEEVKRRKEYDKDMTMNQTVGSPDSTNVQTNDTTFGIKVTNPLSQENKGAIKVQSNVAVAPEAHREERTAFRVAGTDSASTGTNEIQMPSQEPASQAHTQVITVKGVREKVYRKSIPVMNHPKKAQTLGMGRGTGQGRESLGLVIPANMKLYIRQSARHNEGDIRVSLVTDDSRQNRAVVVPKNGNWVNIHTSIDSGAFVYLPRGFRTQPQVDFYVENNQGMMLPTYHKGGDQALFEQQWRDTQASYAFVEGKYNAFLLPKIDRKRIEDMKKSKDANAFKTLDQMLNFYDDVIQKYNQWSGLTDDPNAIHYNVEQKYFTMADKHGAGIAYWSRDHMGSNQPSLRGYLQPGWLALHEVGHGFDGWMIGDGHMELVEIWNNIFANEYQTKVMGVKKDWLYQGKQTQYQKALQDKILKDPSHFTLGRTNVRERLDFLTRMVRLTTFNGVTDMLKAMREEAAKGHVEKDVPRWIIEHWLGDHGYNGLAYFGIYQIKLPKTLIDQANASRNAYVYPLAMLIDNAAERARYAKQLGLSSVYELVRSSDLKDTTIDSHATIHIHRNGQHLPEGAEVKLVDGTETVAIGTIQNDTVNFAHIRPGVYKVIAPLSQNYALPEHAYLIVRENGTNEVTLDYPDANSTQNAMTEHISLKGLANVEFASIDYYPLTKTVVYKQSPAKPHIYYNDEYAHVTIQNQQGEQLLERSFIGNRQSPSEVVTFKMEYGDTIQVKHREATSRRQVFRLENHAEIPMPNKKKETVTYRLTDKGLIVDNETQEAAESRYASQLQSDVNAIIETIKQNPGKDFRTQLYRVVQGVQHVNGREKERLLTQLQPYMEETTTLNTPEPTWTVTEYGRGFVGGNGPAHASIAVTFPSGTVVNTTVENNGEWTVNVPVNESFHPGDEIAAIATIQGKFSSQSVQAAVTDTIAPSPVVVNPFNEHDTVMSGETEPHTTVEVRLPNQQTLTTMSEDGHWSVQLPEGMDLTSNDRIDVIAVDGFKNRSMVNVVTPVDVTPPVKPTVATTESKQHIIWGTGEKYQDQIEVILPNNTVIKTKVGRNLTWMIGVPFDTELVVGDVIKVTEIDRFGNRSQSGTGDVVDTTPPSQPVVQHLLEGSSTLTGQAEPGSHIIVQLSSNQTLETETQADGTWQIDAPEISHITRDDEVSVIARDTSQNMSQETKVVVDPKSMPQSCPTTEESESAQTETLSKEKETSAQETNSKSSSKETATPKTDDQATSEASSQEGATEKVQTPENPLSTPETTDTGETQPEADRTSGTVDEHHGSDSSVMSSEISENTSSSPETNPETTNLDNATAEPPAPENSDTKSESPTGSEGSTSPEESQSASPSEEAVPVESTLTSEVSETGKDQPDVGETTNLDNATAESPASENSDTKSEPPTGSEGSTSPEESHPTQPSGEMTPVEPTPTSEVSTPETGTDRPDVGGTTNLDNATAEPPAPENSDTKSEPPTGSEGSTSPEESQPTSPSEEVLPVESTPTSEVSETGTDRPDVGETTNLDNATVESPASENSDTKSESPTGSEGSTSPEESHPTSPSEEAVPVESTSTSEVSETGKDQPDVGETTNLDNATAEPPASENSDTKSESPTGSESSQPTSPSEEAVPVEPTPTSEVSETGTDRPDVGGTTNLDNATAEPPASENSDTKSEPPTGSEGSTSPEESQPTSPSEEAVPVEPTPTSEVSETGTDRPDVGGTTNLDNATAEPPASENSDTKSEPPTGSEGSTSPEESQPTSPSEEAVPVESTPTSEVSTPETGTDRPDVGGTTNLDNATAEPPASENSDTKSEPPTGSEGSTSPEESQPTSPSEEAVPVESTPTSEVSETGTDRPDVGETTNLDNATVESPASENSDTKSESPTGSEGSTSPEESHPTSPSEEAVPVESTSTSEVSETGTDRPDVGETTNLDNATVESPASENSDTKSESPTGSEGSTSPEESQPTSPSEEAVPVESTPTSEVSETGTDRPDVGETTNLDNATVESPASENSDTKSESPTGSEGSTSPEESHPTSPSEEAVPVESTSTSEVSTPETGKDQPDVGETTNLDNATAESPASENSDTKSEPPTGSEGSTSPEESHPTQPSGEMTPVEPTPTSEVSTPETGTPDVEIVETPTPEAPETGTDQPTVEETTNLDNATAEPPAPENSDTKSESPTGSEVPTSEANQPLASEASTPNNTIAETSAVELDTNVSEGTIESMVTVTSEHMKPKVATSESMEVKSNPPTSREALKTAFATKVPSSSGSAVSETEVLPETGQSEGIDWKAIVLVLFGLGILSKRFSRTKKK